jgi:hypothetical protein
MAAHPPTLPSIDGADSGFNPDFSSPSANGHEDTDGDVALSIVEPAPQAEHASQASQAPQPPDKQDYAPSAQVQEQVHKVLYSDIGVNTLLNRLKASIASARVCLRSAHSSEQSADVNRTFRHFSSAAAHTRKNMPTA